MTFSATSDPRLMRRLARRVMLGIYVPMAAVGFLVAVLVARAGQADDAVGIACGSGVLLFLPGFGAAKAVEGNSWKVGLVRAYRIDPTGITITAGFSTVTLPWSKVKGVRRWRGQIAVYQGWRAILGIPTGSLTKEEQDRLLRVIRSRGAVLTEHSAR
jgi:hypothetical protein